MRPETDFAASLPTHSHPPKIDWCNIIVNTPPAKAGGFGLRLKAGSIGHPANCCRYTT
jgi:hypothetical protein